MVDHYVKKDNPSRIRITPGGNLIYYPDGHITCTANLAATKIVYNGIHSTYDVNYMYIDT